MHAPAQSEPTMAFWTLGLAANTIVAVAYLAIASHIFTHLSRDRQWHNNPLGLATGAIFLSCGLGHGVHAVHALAFPGNDVATLTSARLLLSDWHVWAADGVTALIGVWYWSLRHRFRALTKGASLFEDMRERQRRALAIHDDVVQGLVKAKLALEVGQPGVTARELEATLEASRRIMSDLLGEGDRAIPMAPGQLRRAQPAPEKVP